MTPEAEEPESHNFRGGGRRWSSYFELHLGASPLVAPLSPPLLPERLAPHPHAPHLRPQWHARTSSFPLSAQPPSHRKRARTYCLTPALGLGTNPSWLSSAVAPIPDKGSRVLQPDTEPQTPVTWHVTAESVHTACAAACGHYPILLRECVQHPPNSPPCQR